MVQFLSFKPNPNPILTKLEDEVSNSEDSNDSNYIITLDPTPTMTTKTMKKTTLT